MRIKRRALPESWSVIGTTVVGASHRRAGIQNQDAYGCLPRSGKGPRVAIAVADGHGSAKCFRSDAGARLAVDVGLELAREFLDAESRGTSLSLVKARLETDVPTRLVRGWRQRVDEDLALRPLSDPELGTVAEKDGHPARTAVEQNPYLAYGSTLLGVVATESFLVVWQIGDGDIVTLSADGCVERPLPRDDRLIANETTSLCTPEAWRHFRVAFMRNDAALILVSSDGLSNSFADEAGFLKFGTDLVPTIASHGLAAIRPQLGRWLRRMSDEGSGDDISLAVACRRSALGRVTSAAGSVVHAEMADEQPASSSTAAPDPLPRAEVTDP